MMTPTFANAERSQIVLRVDDRTTVCIPAKPGNRHYDDLIASGVPIAEFEAVETPLAERVGAERDRRVALGFVATLSTGKAFHVDTRDERDFRNLNGLATEALIRVGAGDATPFKFTDGANVDQVLSPAEMLETTRVAAQWVMLNHEAARAIKKLETPPDDITAAALWP